VAILIGTVTLLAVLASTLAGGAVPLRFERHSRTFLSFSAGTLVGLALLELIPAALEETAGAAQNKLLVVLCAFLATMLLDKLHILHPHPHRMDADCPPEEHVHRPLAMHGAVGLLVHSAVDGLALATALKEAPHTAVAVGLALAAHKFADGLTTVSLVLSHHHRRAQAVRLLAANAGLLLIGFALGMSLALQKAQLAGLLLVMAGFFLYLGASDLIPSVTVPVCRKRDVFATACGMAAIAAIATLVH
jgi:zinc transporter ZupT